MKLKTRREKLEDVKCAGNVNPGLWLDKFIGGPNVGKANSDEKTFKQQLVDESAKTIKIFADYKAFFTRRMENLAQIEPNVFRAIEIDSRMICGLGAASVWENAISIHRTYGVPFIPGSSLKGLAASYAHKYLGEEWRKDAPQTLKLSDNELELSDNEKVNFHEFVFGSQNSAGFVTFHDALIMPESTKTQFIHADIMTVHHPKYYSGADDAPADWDSPTPINFVSASGKYLLTLTTVEGGENWLELTAQILKEAFKTEGIGAKTSSGYGRAILTENYPKTSEMERQENKRQEKIKADAEEKRLELKAEFARAEIQRQKELAQERRNQTKQKEKQQQENSKFAGIQSAVAALTSDTKKLEKEFDRLRERIHKIENIEQKRELAAAAIEKVEQLQSEGAKIDASGKWFATLKKMKGEN